MKEKLYDIKAQLVLVLTEAPWRIGLNERPHRYLRKSIDRLLLQKNYETCHDHGVLLEEVETG